MSLHNETLPFWFAMMSPLIGVVFGFACVWIFGR